METITPEELAAEQAATTQVKEEEVRANIISEYGFDEENDIDRIDKLVSREMEQAERLSTAIGQKIKHRNDANELRKNVTKPSQVVVPATEDIGKAVSQEMDKRELGSLEYSDELKKEIQRVAQVQNIPIKQALRDPYIVFKIGEEEKEEKVQEASISRTNKSAGKKNYSMDAPPDVDMATESGRKEYDDWKVAMIKAGN